MHRAADRVEADSTSPELSGVRTWDRAQASGLMTAPARALALQRAIGNRAATRMLLREPKDPAPSGPRVPKTYQVADRDLPRVAADPELAQRALEFRVKNGMLTPEAFGQNVAVVKYEQDGKIDYLVRANDPGKLHSEIEAIKELERLDPGWKRTQILEVYTERHPCASCWPNLQGVRGTIKKIRAGQGKPATDFRTYYSVPKDEPGRTRAPELGKQYFSGGVSRTSGSVTDTSPPPPSPSGRAAPKAAPSSDTDVPPPPTGAPGAPSKTPGPGAPQPGRFTEVGFAVGSAALTVGIGLLSSYLKARVDRKIAAAQIDRNQAKAVQVINGQVNTILKMMLSNPEKTLYARVYMSSAVISTYEASATSPEPTMSDSAPIIDLTGVGFTFVPLDPALADTFQDASAGGRHMILRRLFVSEIPLVTPPIEDLIALAKARKLPLDDLRGYVLERFAGIDQHEEPKKFIADVDHWQHILDLVNAVPPRP
jgi:hypothetical protein